MTSTIRDCIVYRSDCAPSAELLKHFVKLPIAENFIVYNIDADPKTGKRNTDLIRILGIKKTPTVFHQGKKYDDRSAFEWLQAMYNQINAAENARTVVERPSPDYTRQPNTKVAPPPPPPSDNFGSQFMPSASSGGGGSGYVDLSEAFQGAVGQNDFPIRMQAENTKFTGDSRPLGGNELDERLRQLQEERQIGVPLPPERM